MQLQYSAKYLPVPLSCWKEHKDNSSKYIHTWGDAEAGRGSRTSTWDRQSWRGNFDPPLPQAKWGTHYMYKSPLLPVEEYVPRHWEHWKNQSQNTLCPLYTHILKSNAFPVPISICPTWWPWLSSFWVQQWRQLLCLLLLHKFMDRAIPAVGLSLLFVLFFLWSRNCTSFFSFGASQSQTVVIINQKKGHLTQAPLSNGSQSDFQDGLHTHLGSTKQRDRPRSRQDRGELNEILCTIET